MKKNLPTLDTNLLIRFLINDIPSQVDKIESLFKNATSKSLYISDVVLIETVFVLLSLYRLSKKEVIDKISATISYEKFYVDKQLFQKVIEIYSQHNISIVDSYTGALTALDRNNKLYTFDQKLLKILELKAQTP